MAVAPDFEAFQELDSSDLLYVAVETPRENPTVGQVLATIALVRAVQELTEQVRKLNGAVRGYEEE